MKTKIMQQENPKGGGVQQHLERPGFERTFCGRDYNENWHNYHELDLENDKVEDHVSCLRCRSGAAKFLREKSKIQYNRAFIVRNEISKPLLEAVDTGEYTGQWLFDSGESFHGEHDGEFFYFKDSRISSKLKLPLSCVKLEFYKSDFKGK